MVAPTGPNPTDRAKGRTYGAGTKRHIVIDAEGIPLAVLISAANVHDSRMLESTLDTVPPVHHSNAGRPRFWPLKLHADKGDDFKRFREALRRRGITPRIARRGIESGERLGRHRWVVERTLAWLNQYRRLRIRYERHADMHEALLTLGCALICWKRLQRTFSNER